MRLQTWVAREAGENAGRPPFSGSRLHQHYLRATFANGVRTNHNLITYAACAPS